MSEADRAAAPGGFDVFRQEVVQFWRAMPGKALFLACVLVWVVLFYFWGNATLGYHATPSLFSWLSDKYSDSQDNGHCILIPFVILALFWWKRQEVLAVPKSPWWPASLLLAVTLLIHVFGFLVQQTLISTAAFFLGFYALIGMVWGYRMLRVSFFPYFLSLFCIPLSGEPMQRITFPLRLLSTHITTFISKVLLGINVIQEGTKIKNPTGSYEYEIAAACSGIHSLLAAFALAVIYAFIMLKSPWRRLLMIAMAFPLAVASNAFRLTFIILAAELFGGQSAGNYVHESSWMSLLPYIPLVAGIILCGWLLQENRHSRKKEEPVTNGLEQKS